MNVYMTIGYNIYFTNPQGFRSSPTLPPTPLFMKIPLFSNNAIVCYKQASLAPSGAGTVRNARKKAYKT
jgi:hypothetical protein